LLQRNQELLHVQETQQIEKEQQMEKDRQSRQQTFDGLQEQHQRAKADIVEAQNEMVEIQRNENERFVKLQGKYDSLLQQNQELLQVQQTQKMKTEQKAEMVELHIALEQISKTIDGLPVSTRQKLKQMLCKTEVQVSDQQNYQGCGEIVSRQFAVVDGENGKSSDHLNEKRLDEMLQIQKELEHKTKQKWNTLVRESKKDKEIIAKLTGWVQKDNDTRMQRPTRGQMLEISPNDPIFSENERRIVVHGINARYSMQIKQTKTALIIGENPFRYSEIYKVIVGDLSLFHGWPDRRRCMVLLTSKGHVHLEMNSQLARDGWQKLIEFRPNAPDMTPLFDNAGNWTIFARKGKGYQSRNIDNHKNA